MSRIGKKPIEIPEGVTVQVNDGEIAVEGPKGLLSLTISKEIKVEHIDSQIRVSLRTASAGAKSLWGTTRQLIFNMVKGVKDGWSKSLEVVGVGYRVALLEDKLILSLGFSHQVEVVPPAGISFLVSEKKVTVLGTDKELVGRVAAKLRAIRPPDPYKGKGIRYEHEEIKLKPGKQVKTGIAGGPQQGAAPKGQK